MKSTLGIEFYNRQATRLELWIEPACIEVHLEPSTEYRIEADETEYRFEFDGSLVVLYLQYRFGLKLYKRAYSTDFKNPPAWQLLEDYSDI